MTLKQSIRTSITRTRTTGPMTFRACQNRHCNKGANKQSIKDDEEDSEHVATAIPETAAEGCGDEGVENCGGDDAFHGAVGSGGLMDEAEDFGEAEGEEDEGGEGGEELERTEEVVV